MSAFRIPQTIGSLASNLPIQWETNLDFEDHRRLSCLWIPLCFLLSCTDLPTCFLMLFSFDTGQFWISLLTSPYKAPSTKSSWRDLIWQMNRFLGTSISSHTQKLQSSKIMTVILSNPFNLLIKTFRTACRPGKKLHFMASCGLYGISTQKDLWKDQRQGDSVGRLCEGTQSIF